MMALRTEKGLDGTEHSVMRIYGNDNIDDVIGDFNALIEQFCSPVMIRSARIFYNPMHGIRETFPLKLFMLDGTEIWVDDILPKDCPKILKLAGFSEADYRIEKP